MKKTTLSLLLIVILQLVHSQEIYIDVRVYLEGPFNGTDMNTDLKNQDLIPLDQPFNQSPWNYAGTESASSLQSDWVDWVLVELRETAGDASTATSSTVIAREACILQKDGSIIAHDAFGYPTFNLTITENLYVVIYHRNHLNIMSSGPLTLFFGNTYFINFTDQLSKAYLDGQKEIAPGIFGMIAGDCDASGVIDMDDQNYCWELSAGENGYESSDLNMDGEINNIDKDDFWNPNLGLRTGVFTCGELLTDIRDSQQYTTVQIGTQCWMAKNLNIGSMINSSGYQSDNDIIEKYCFDDDLINCDDRGGMYQWDELMQYGISAGGQGVCPAGWHLPSDDEWMELTDLMGGLDVAGGKMKATSGWYGGGNGTDEYGFTGIPGGHINALGDFYYMTSVGNFWSSTQNGSDASRWYLYYDDDDVVHINYSKLYGYSVRCVQGYINQQPVQPSNPEPGDEAIDIGVDTVLSWTCSDPDGEDLNYTLYLGTDPNPPITVEDLTEPTVNPILDFETTYFWKVTAIDIWGDSAVSDIWSFTTEVDPFVNCGDNLVDTRDAHSYNTVEIGTQCWMAENLNIGTRIDGNVDQSENSPIEIIEKYCYDDMESNCDTYGGLYQWNELMQFGTTQGTQGICPTGWYIPTDDDWCTLTQFIDPTINCNDYASSGTDAGTKMKSTSGWASGGNGTDDFGFTALPSGYRRYNDGAFIFNGMQAHFWSSTQNNSNPDIAWFRKITNADDHIYRYNDDKDYGFQVRCIKNQPPTQPTNPIPGDASIDIGVDTVLTWACTDPDGYDLNYTLYFGTAPNPPLLAENLTEPTYNPILDYETNYYWKVVAFDILGDSAESDIWSFTTKSFVCGDDPIIDLRDGQLYSTVEIGTQCWMAENLNIGTRIDGNVDQSENSPIEIIEKYCYNDLESNCDAYGGLYQWNEMMEYTPFFKEGICPAGWHIPTNAEWTSLTEFLGGLSVAGGKMKEVGFVHWDYHVDGGATNESGFTALPGGSIINGNFYDLRNRGIYWSSTEDGSNARIRAAWYDNTTITEDSHSKNYGFSVRCLKNPPNQPPSQPSNPAPADASLDIGVDTVLSWTCSDPDADDLIYPLYFGTEPNPPLLAENLTEPTFNPILDFETTYYWKVTAFDIWGDSAVSDIWSFTTKSFVCGDDPISDLRDGQLYSTVEIGTQCWMAENLNIGTRIDGNVEQSENSPNEIIEKYCYSDLESNCDAYGGLYQWNEMMDYSIIEGAQGICPTGWHIPTDDEWTNLTYFCGGSYVAGGKMKSTMGWYNGGNGTDEFGFTALPAGYEEGDDGGFHSLSRVAAFWTSTEDYTPWGAYIGITLNWQSDYVNTEHYKMDKGKSVRCLKSPPINQAPLPPSDPIPTDASIDVNTETNLSWNCSDPDGDNLVYKVYLGFDVNPPVVAQNLTGTMYDPVLLFDTTYFWKVTAFDIWGDSTESNLWTFTTREPDPFVSCGDLFPDYRDGHTYSTVQIGTQCWMAENLNIGTRIDGNVDQSENSPTEIIEKYCYNNLESNCYTYGGLYQWNELMDYSTTEGVKGICPTGWHIPTDDEWCTLTQFIDATVDCSNIGLTGTDIGTKMKSTSGWASPGNGTDIFGFTGLPGGLRNWDGGDFIASVEKGYFWTSTQNDVSTAWFRRLNWDYNGIFQYNDSKNYGFSVRCMKD